MNTHYKDILYVRVTQQNDTLMYDTTQNVFQYNVIQQMTNGKIKHNSPDICQKLTNINDFQKNLQLIVRATKPPTLLVMQKKGLKYKTFSH
jgi:hypothetical protein